MLCMNTIMTVTAASSWIWTNNKKIVWYPFNILVPANTEGRDATSPALLVDRSLADLSRWDTE